MATIEYLEKEMKDVTASLQAAPWDNKNFYHSWLAQSYYYTRHSTRMLAFAAGSTEPGTGEYFRRCLKHIREEQGHEQVALNDLKNSGGDIANLPEMGITRALWEPQFYKMQKDPYSLLGYILSLETLAVLTFKELSKKTLDLYSENANRFIHIHAEDDPHHVTEAIDQVEKCPQNSKEIIMDNFHQTNTLYRCFLQEIEREVTKTK